MEEHIIIFQGPAALINDLISKGYVAGATSCRARCLYACYVVTCVADTFRPYQANSLMQCLQCTAFSN
jgi:hypothetical protein